MHCKSTVISASIVAALAAVASAAAQTPPIGGPYGPPNVIPIPVKDGAIAGALFKPAAAAAPSPAVIYMSGCSGLSLAEEIKREKTVIDHNLKKGFATLIVDPFTARREEKGVCDQFLTAGILFDRGGHDFEAARAVLSGMSDIDQSRVFLQGYSYGAVSAGVAVDKRFSMHGHMNVAGLVQYYPQCSAFTKYTVPTLILIGEKDEWTPAAYCEGLVSGQVEVKIYPGATHGFALPFPQPREYMGATLAYDEAATRDADGRVDRFMKAPSDCAANQ